MRGTVTRGTVTRGATVGGATADCAGQARDKPPIDGAGGTGSSNGSNGSGDPLDPLVDPPVDPQAVARQICLHLLTQRARSRAELAQGLAKRNVPTADAQAVLDRFAEVGLIDDGAVAESVVRSALDRGQARRAMAKRLRDRGIGDEEATLALAAVSPGDERAAARALVARRLPTLAGLPDQVKARRLHGLLARRGYSAGLAFEVVREVVIRASEAADFAG